jgi:hypothetical protein
VRLATNLMKLHAKDEDKIRGLIEMLATRLGSHDYLIGPTEARELKLHVADENPALESLIWELYEDYAQEMELGTPFDRNIEMQVAVAQNRSAAPIRKVLKIVMIESLVRTDVWDRDIVITSGLGQI